MKITLYTISDCAFSKQEKEYLTANKLQYEEKNMETNKEFLTEMLAVSNNFAGTPVTKIEKDDGQIAVLKGFTKDEFDKALGVQTTPAKSDVALDQMNAGISIPPPAPSTTPPPPTPPQPEPTPGPTPTPIPVSEPQTPTVQAPAEPVSATSPTPPTPAKDEPLNNVLNNLQTKAGSAVVTPSVPVTPNTPSAPGTLPHVPDFNG